MCNARFLHFNEDKLHCVTTIFSNKVKHLPMNVCKTILLKTTPYCTLKSIVDTNRNINYLIDLCQKTIYLR